MRPDREVGLQNNPEPPGIWREIDVPRCPICGEESRRNIYTGESELCERCERDAWEREWKEEEDDS